MTGDKKIHLQPIVDRILDLNLMFGKLDLYEESPKGVCADRYRNTRKYSAKSGVETCSTDAYPPRPLCT
jgi:hypothetical protein